MHKNVKKTKQNKKHDISKTIYFIYLHYIGRVKYVPDGAADSRITILLLGIFTIRSLILVGSVYKIFFYKV